MKYFLKLCVILVLFAWVTASGQSAPPDTDGTEGTVRYPAAVTDLKAFDTDNDHGHSVTLTWELSADDGAGANSVLAYWVFRWFPRQMDVVDSLRHKVSNTRSTVRAFRLDIPRARSALRELRDDPGKLESLRFRVAAPEDDNMFVLTAEYAIRALEDTITAMEEQLPLLKGRIRPLQKEFGEAVERLPEAHGQYPQDGVWRSVGKAASGNAEYINSGAKEEAASDFIPDHTDLYYSVDAVTVDSTVRASSDCGLRLCSGLLVPHCHVCISGQEGS